jgi:AraC-like DNA-binding protein
MKITLTSILYILSFSLFSQNTKIDSLKQMLTHANGSEKVLVLNELAIGHWNVDLTKSISYGKEALRLADQLKFTKAKARTYNIIGVAYFNSNNFDVANQYYNKCISTAQKYGTKEDIYRALGNKVLLYFNGYVKDSVDQIQIYKQYINLIIYKKNYIDLSEIIRSFVYVFHSKQSDNIVIRYLTYLRNQTKNNSEIQAVLFAGEGYYNTLNNDYFKAIESYKIALNLTKIKSYKILYLDRIGIVYFEVRKYKESLHFYKEALQIMNNNDFELKINMEYLVAADIGASYLQLKDYKTAITYLQYASQNSDFVSIDKGAIYNNLGLAYLSIDNIKNADLYLSKAFSILDPINYASGKLANLNSIAELSIKRKQLNKLNDVLAKISTLVPEVKDYYIVSDSYKQLSDYYGKAGNYKKSNKYLKKMMIANDSINNREFINKMSEFQFKYETEKKEQQISLQQSIIKQKDQFIVFSIIAGSVILLALLIIFILYRKKNQAYKLLVYQSLQNTDNEHLLTVNDQPDDENVTKMRYNNSNLDEDLKRQIQISLNNELESKVFADSNLTLKILAVKCNTNRSYFSQFIHEQYHMNFNSFINMLRINEAKLMLADKNNDLPLKELYLRLGFNTYSVFNEAFKRHVGVTPAFYLKTFQELQNVTNMY